MSEIIEVGYLEKGTGKHQSNIVYGAGGVAPTLCAALGVKTSIMILDEGDKYEQDNTVGKSKKR